jgi:FKBP-type peptidyl-prolyl cis-trans isomerase
MRTQRVVSFLLAAFLIASSLGAVFLVFRQSKEINDADKISQEAASKKANNETNQKECSVKGSPASNNKPGDVLKLSAPVTELQITDAVVGTGEEARLNDCITVNYRLSLIDGSIVAGNDTFTSGRPIAFDLVEGGLIEGWIKGIPGMKVGGLRRLVVPAAMGYGDRGTSGIPAGSTLVFDIELLDTTR